MFASAGQRFIRAASRGEHNLVPRIFGVLPKTQEIPSHMSQLMNRIVFGVGGVSCRRFATTTMEHARPLKATAQKGRFRLGVGGLFLVCSGAFVVDDGFNRCVRFWLTALPIYAHYVYVDKISHPVRKDSNTDEINSRRAALESLHQRYSPIIERTTLRMRGFYLKAAQLMSMREDFLPDIYLLWTRKLQNDAPVTLSGEDARRCVVKELGLGDGGDVSEVFDDWNDEPIGSASIGQVFRARLRATGEEVAVKVQSPGVENMFRRDIRTLIFFTSFALPWAAENLRAVEKMFEAEFDFHRECQNIQMIREALLPHWGAKVKVPKPHPEYSSRLVLCMELLRGEKLVDGVRRRMRSLAQRAGMDPEAYELEQIEALREGKRKCNNARIASWRFWVWKLWRQLRWGDGGDVLDLAAIMETIVEVHGEQVLRHGVFNADPHPGNILLLEDGKTLGLIDFGQVAQLPVELRMGVARLVVALANRDQAAVAQCERECGLKTRYSKDDVRYRICNFWMDRDTAEITQGLNLADFMAWGEREDPVMEFPQDLYLVYRCSVVIRSLALAFGVNMSTSQYWRPFAEDALNSRADGTTRCSTLATA